MPSPHDLDPSRPYRRSAQLALRPEPFGALAYHFGNRRLAFLTSPLLVELVSALDEQPSVEAAFAALDVPAARRPAFLRALGDLARSDMIEPAEVAA